MQDDKKTADDMKDQDMDVDFDEGMQAQGGSQKVNPVQVQKFLKGVDYPADKNELIQAAKDEGADENVISMLESLPDEQYQTPADLSQAIGAEE